MNVNLNWVPMPDKQEARFGECVFTLRKTKRGYSLNGKGIIPPDGGFNIKADGTELNMKSHAETLASAYAQVTEMSFTCADWNAKHVQSMRVKVSLFNVKRGCRGRTVGAAFEHEGVHLIGVQFVSNGRTSPVRLDIVTVIGPNE